MSQTAQKWLLVQWNSGSRDVIHADAVDTPEDELSIGCRLTMSRRGEPEPRVGTLIDRSRSRSVLNTPPTGGVAGLSSKPDDEDEDYSPSCSSWSPSQEAESTDSEEEIVRKKVKLDNSNRHFLSRKRSRTKSPAHSISPIMPQERERDNTTGASGESMKTLRIPHRQILLMQARFTLLFRILSEIKNYRNGIPHSRQDKTENDDSQVNITAEPNETTKEAENLKRSIDNSNQTNKNKKIKSTAPVLNQKVTIDKKNDDKKWVAIGSGKTTIHVDRYRKVKWKSYTAATRSLLLAAFTRRVLATHSLTGRPSPAFKNKPAKMCLDQRITSDIITEVTNRFDVKENLVRSIITTKCADECKMWKQRMRKNHSKTKPRGQENEPPTEGVNGGPQSTTCSQQ